MPSLAKAFTTAIKGPLQVRAEGTQRAGTGYRLGSELGSPNHGSTLASKRVMAQIRSPARVSTWKPVAWRIPAGTRRYAPNAGWPLARVGTRSNLRPAPNWRAQYRVTASRPSYPN